MHAKVNNLIRRAWRVGVIKRWDLLFCSPMARAAGDEDQVLDGLAHPIRFRSGPLNPNPSLEPRVDLGPVRWLSAAWTEPLQRLSALVSQARPQPDAGEANQSPLPGIAKRAGLRPGFAVALVAEEAEPTAPQADENATPIDHDVMIARLAGLRLLVVDDHPVNRLVVKMLAEPYGCLVAECEDGGAALNALTSREYDLVLMDVNMPGIDGLEATRRIRAELGLTALPILALTGDTLAAHKVAVLAAGMNAQMSKPIDADELIMTLARWAPRPLPEAA